MLLSTVGVHLFVIFYSLYFQTDSILRLLFQPSSHQSLVQRL